MKLIIVQTTCASEQEAKDIARSLVNENLAACVQVADIESFYRWNNKLCDDKEKLLSIKTKKENFKKIKSRIKELHSYDVPEIIAININNVSKDYKKFVNKNC